MATAAVTNRNRLPSCDLCDHEAVRTVALKSKYRRGTTFYVCAAHTQDLKRRLAEGAGVEPSEARFELQSVFPF